MVNQQQVKTTALKQLSQVGIRGVAAMPERMLRGLFGDPPRNDRGHEQDLHTHALLRLMALSGQAELHRHGLHKARRLYALSGLLMDLPEPRLAERRELRVAGAGGELRARAYLPRARTSDALLLWFHGGGYVIGDLDTHAGALATLAAHSGVTVLAVDYRKSPEHPFPAASDDGLAALSWARAHAGQLDCDPRRVAVGGDSAGGNLSAGLCHRLLQAGEPQPLAQLLVYPLTQCNSEFPSRDQFAAGPLLSRDMIQWFRGQYLRSPSDAADPRISVLLAERFEGLAPAVIHTAGFDPLRDEGDAYAEVLRGAGVEVRHHCHPGLIHGYFTMGATSPASREAILSLGDELRRVSTR